MCSSEPLRAPQLLVRSSCPPPPPPLQLSSRAVLKVWVVALERARRSCSSLALLAHPSVPPAIHSFTSFNLAWRAEGRKEKHSHTHARASTHTHTQWGDVTYRRLERTLVGFTIEKIRALSLLGANSWPVSQLLICPAFFFFLLRYIILSVTVIFILFISRSEKWSCYLSH